MTELTKDFQEPSMVENSIEGGSGLPENKKKFSLTDIEIQNTSPLFNYHFIRTPYRFSLFVESWIFHLSDSPQYVFFKDADYYKSSSPCVPFRQKPHQFPQCITSSSQLFVESELSDFHQTKNGKAGLRIFNLRKTEVLDCPGVVRHMKNFVELIDQNSFRALRGSVELMDQFEKNGKLEEYRARYGSIFTEMGPLNHTRDHLSRVCQTQCYIGSYTETAEDELMQEQNTSFNATNPPKMSKGKTYNVYFSYPDRKSSNITDRDISFESLDKDGAQIHFVTSVDGSEDLTVEFIKKKMEKNSKRLLTQHFKHDHTMLSLIPPNQHLITQEKLISQYRTIYDSLVDITPNDLQVAHVFLLGRFMTEAVKFHNHPLFDQFPGLFTYNFQELDPSLFVYVYRKLKLCPSLASKCRGYDETIKRRNTLLEMDTFNVRAGESYVILRKMRASVAVDDFDKVQTLDIMSKQCFTKCAKQAEELFGTQKKIKANQMAADFKSWCQLILKDPKMAETDDGLLANWRIEMTCPVFDKTKFIEFVSFINMVLLDSVANLETLLENPSHVINIHSEYQKKMLPQKPSPNNPDETTGW